MKRVRISSGAATALRTVGGLAGKLAKTAEQNAEIFGVFAQISDALEDGIGIEIGAPRKKKRALGAAPKRKVRVERVK